MNNRVWIEIERPKNDEEGHERAKQLSKMLKRLGLSYKEPVFWYPKKQCYCFTIDSGGSFVEANDNGQWYNLDYFAE